MGKEGLEGVLKFRQKDLATDIYESSMLMGLIPVKDKDKSIEEIRKRLSTCN